MQYGQIVFLLFIAFLFYYAVLIVLDIQKAKMAQAAEQENHSEEEIDISDEARSFKPVRIERDEPPRQQAENKNENSSDDLTNKEEPPEKPYHHPGYREAIMTDGILVDNLIEEINHMAEIGTSDLGVVIFNCENAK